MMSNQNNGVAAELTDEQIDAVWKDLDGDNCWLRTFGYQQFARAVLAKAAPVAILSETQQYRTGYGEGVRAAAKLCDAKYSARVESGHPREASTARALAGEILNLQSISPAAPVAAADFEEGREILESLISNIEEGGNYSAEATLNFLAQIKQCFAAPTVAVDGS